MRWSWGLAFQLQDDLLDSYGTEEELGKKDRRRHSRGQEDLPHAARHEPSRGGGPRDTAQHLLRRDAGRREKIARVKAVYDRYDVPRTVNQQISLRFERALSILDTLDIAAERTEHLRVFARNLMGRKK